MPRGDGTGPMGQGPMTGRGAGFCAGFSTPGFANSTSSLGMGFRRGAGRGAGRRRAKVPVGNQTSAQNNLQASQVGSNQNQAANSNVQPQTQGQPQSNQNIQILADKIAALENQVNQIKNTINQLTG